jgi:hypothetical protein
MRRKYLHLFLLLLVFLTVACVKETYDMTRLSKRAHISPTMALSAIKGNISLSDMVKSGDTVVFNQDKTVKLVFKIDTILDFTMADFLPVKALAGDIGNNTVNPEASPGKLVATIIPDTLDLNFKDVLSHISGTFGVTNPSITINYSNSFPTPLELNIIGAGQRGTSKVNLNMAPFMLLHPAGLTDPAVSGSVIINKDNSDLPELISLPPEKIFFSGMATLNTAAKDNPDNPALLLSNRLTASLNVEIPLEFKMNNLQFTDTLDNFLKNDSTSSINPEDFKMLRVDFSANNGFPLGVSVKMSLYDSRSRSVKSSIEAASLLLPALTDSNGKVTQETESKTSIEFTSDFFSSISKADKIIFIFRLNTTGNGANDVKIYSNYFIDFKAAVVVKPDINL